MILSKRLLRRTDLTLIIAAAAIVIMSLVVIGSATHINAPSDERYWFVQRQGVSILVDIALAVFLMNFDYKILQRYGNYFYIFNLVLLILVMLVGQTALGAQRWIALGPISIQPSEFSKLIMIIALAAMLEKRGGKINTLGELLPVAAAALIAGLLAFVLIPAKPAAPAFSLTSLDGRPVNNGTLNGKVSFINFWYPSCPGCVKEMPLVIKMAHDYQGKDFQILGIAEPTSNPADSLDGVKNYVAKQGIPFEVMFDGDKAVAKKFLKTELYPTSVLLNKKGEVLKTFVGEPDFAALYRVVDDEMAK